MWNNFLNVEVMNDFPFSRCYRFYEQIYNETDDNFRHLNDTNFSILLIIFLLYYVTMGTARKMFYDAAIKKRLSAKLLPIFSADISSFLDHWNIFVLTKAFNFADFKSALGGNEKKNGWQLKPVSDNGD